MGRVAHFWSTKREFLSCPTRNTRRTPSAPTPPLIHDPVSAYGMVTPHGVATVSTEHPTSSEQETEDEYPAITLSVNGFPHATMEWHPDYHTWVLRAYTKHEENPVVYIRLDTGVRLDTGELLPG